MELYNFIHSPNGQRVDIFMKEKNIDIPTINVDLMKLENHRPDMKAMNPSGTLPFLKVSDSVIIPETMAICRYLEAKYPHNPMFGYTPEEQGMIESVRRRIEFEGLLMVSDVMRNSLEFFKDRGLPGKQQVPQIPALAERGVEQCKRFLAWMEEHLSGSEFMVGNSFSIADIDAYATIQSMKLINIMPEHTNTLKWLVNTKNRASVK